MITRRLVEPSYQSIRLMDFLNCIPLSLELKAGKLSHADSLVTRIFHYLQLSLASLKCIHIAYALVQLLMDFNMESLHIIVLTALCLSLLGTSTYWSWELFHRGLEETIILFNSLDYACDNEQVPKWRSVKDLKSAILWVKAAFRLLLSLNLQELMCVATPFLTKLLVVEGTPEY